MNERDSIIHVIGEQMGWKKRLLAWLCWLPLVSCSPAEPPAALAEIDWQTVRVEGRFAVGHLSPERIEVAGKERTFSVYVPERYDGKRAMPLLFNLHAFNADGAKQERISRMTPLAEEFGFILVYPNAVGSPAAWSYRPGLANNADLQFFVWLIDELAVRLNIDTKRVFVMGLSNGGGMAHRVACDLAERIAGIATVAGVYPAMTLCESSAGVPILAFHGNADLIVPFQGGGEQGLLAVDRWAFSWAERNGCDRKTFTETERYGLTTWTNCQHNSDVSLYELYQWDHYWPNPEAIPPDSADPGVDASRLIATFFASIAAAE